MDKKKPVTHEVEIREDDLTLEQVKASVSTDDFVQKVHDAFQTGSNVQVNQKIKR